MSSIEAIVSMLEVMPEEARLLVMEYTQNLFSARKSESPYTMKGESQILDDLAESREEIEKGMGLDIQDALKQMGEEHGFIS